MNMQSVHGSLWVNIDQVFWREMRRKGLDKHNVHDLLTPLWHTHVVKDQVYHELWDNHNANR